MMSNNRSNTGLEPSKVAGVISKKQNKNNAFSGGGDEGDDDSKSLLVHVYIGTLGMCVTFVTHLFSLGIQRIAVISDSNLVGLAGPFSGWAVGGTLSRDVSVCKKFLTPKYYVQSE